MVIKSNESKIKSIISEIRNSSDTPPSSGHLNENVVGVKF